MREFAVLFFIPVALKINCG